MNGHSDSSERLRHCFQESSARFPSTSFPKLHRTHFKKPVAHGHLHHRHDNIMSCPTGFPLDPISFCGSKNRPGERVVHLPKRNGILRWNAPYVFSAAKMIRHNLTCPEREHQDYLCLFNNHCQNRSCRLTVAASVHNSALRNLPNLRRWVYNRATIIMTRAVCQTPFSLPVFDE
ncbi:hypothetical protein BKA80DRAFT_84204 [Phyllosticta citrichinensis]